jgi:hypothetical protein
MARTAFWWNSVSELVFSHNCRRYEMKDRRHFFHSWQADRTNWSRIPTLGLWRNIDSIFPYTLDLLEPVARSFK